MPKYAVFFSDGAGFGCEMVQPLTFSNYSARANS
jgi:hypothetical protein